MGKDRSYSTAIHILTVLGFHYPELVSSEALAKGLKTNPGLIRRVLLKLSDQGLVISIKGKGGGNRLAKSADKISLEEVYLAMKEGPLFGSFDKEPFKACKVSCNMGQVLREVYGGLEEDLKKSMRKIKLSKIMSQFV